MRLRELATRPGALRVSKADGYPEKRRLAGQSQAHLSALHRGWAYGADQITQEAGAAVADSLTVRKVGDGNCSKKSSIKPISEDAVIGSSSADFKRSISAESAT